MRNRIVLALFLLLACALASAQAGPRVALLIGNARYADLPQRPGATQDIDTVAAALRNAGFETVAIEKNADKAGIEAALKAFSRQAAGAQAAVIYYAGHGMAVDGVNYLLPVDAKIATVADVDYEAVPLDLMLRAVDGAKALKLIVIDASQDGAVLRRGDGKRAVSRGLAPVVSEKIGADTLVALSAAPGTVSADDGRYAQAFAAAVATPGLDVYRVLGLVHDKIVQATKAGREPIVYGTPGGTPFYFVDKPPTPAATETPEAANASDMNDNVQFEELSAWNAALVAKTESSLRSYLERYPNGIFAEPARARIAARRRGTPETVVLHAASPDLQRALDLARTNDQTARDYARQAIQTMTLATDAAERAKKREAGYVIETYYERRGMYGFVHVTYLGEKKQGSETALGATVYSDEMQAIGEHQRNRPRGLMVVVMKDGGRMAGKFIPTSRSIVGIASGKRINGAYMSGMSGCKSRHLCGAVHFEDGTEWLGYLLHGVLDGYGARLDAAGNIIEQGYYEKGVLGTEP